MGLLLDVSFSWFAVSLNVKVDEQNKNGKSVDSIHDANEAELWISIEEEPNTLDHKQRKLGNLELCEVSLPGHCNPKSRHKVVTVHPHMHK